MAASSDASARLFIFRTVSVSDTSATMESVSVSSRARNVIRRAVLFQFVEQGLRTDGQQLGRPGAVVARVLKRHLNQRPFRFIDGHARFQHDERSCRPRGCSGSGRPAKPRGSSAGPIVPSPARITARSITLRNSRTFPGQS